MPLFILLLFLEDYLNVRFQTLLYCLAPVDSHARRTTLTSQKKGPWHDKVGSLAQKPLAGMQS